MKMNLVFCSYAMRFALCDFMSIGRWMVNGAELLVRTAVASGVEACFANAGTTEIPIVMALDSIPGIRVYLGLFEGVCTGAADG